MGFWLGVAWSIAGALAHTGIDALRKLGAARIPAADLVALVAVFDALNSSLLLHLLENGFTQLAQVTRPRPFYGIVGAASSLLLLSKLMYQRALAAAPLSLTVPYLAFTPVMILVTAFLLLGEVPTAWGGVGVAVVAAGGYLLAVRTAPQQGQHIACAQPLSSPSKAKASGGVGSGGTSPGALEAGEGQPTVLGIIPNGKVPAKQASVNGRTPSWQLGSSVSFDRWLPHQGSGRRSSESSSGLLAVPAGWSSGGAGSVWALKFQSPSKRAAAAGESARAQAAAGAASSPRLSSRLASRCAARDHTGSGLSGSGSGSVVTVGVLSDGNVKAHQDAAGGQARAGADSAAAGEQGGVLQQQQQHSGSAGSMLSLLQLSSSNGRVVAAAAKAEACNGKPPGRLRNAGGAGGWRAAAARLLRRWFVAPPPELGPAIVLVVAALWSVTAALDKLGVQAGPSLWAYCLAQRLVIGAACGGYLLATDPRGALGRAAAHWPLLMAVSLLELAAVVFFLEAIDNLFVSYVVAIKRTNVLFSTLAGALLFGEAVGRRVPYILLMLAGMVVIVCQPGHGDLHHTHRTSRM